MSGDQRGRFCDFRIRMRRAEQPPELSRNMALRVVGARLDRDRDGLLVFFVGVVLFRVAAAVYFLTHLLVAAAPVVMLASFVAVSQLASNTSRRVVGQRGGAGGACCEDHFWLGGGAREFACRVAKLPSVLQAASPRVLRVVAAHVVAPRRPACKC